MPANVFNLLPQLTERMPKWVQIIAFFVVLGLSVYLYLAPTFVDGQVVTRTTNGGFIPYRGVDINVSIKSRTMKFKTNENGDWSVPLVSRLPGDLRLMVYHEDEHAFFEVIVKAEDIWLHDFRIVVEDDPPRMQLEPLAAVGEHWWQPVFAALTPQQAQAGELRITDAAENPQALQAVQTTVEALVADTLDQPTQQINPEAPLIGEGAPRYAQRIQIIQEVESKFDLSIPDEHWRHLKTVGELADYVYKRSQLSEQAPASNLPVKSNYNWGAVQQQFPPEQRPVFIPDSSLPAKPNNSSP